MKKLPRAPRLRALPKTHRVPLKKTRAPTTSSGNVTGHEYDPETGHLTVTYNGGRKYRYEGVSAETAKGMDDATSLGSYLHSHVIGKHDTSKI